MATDNNLINTDYFKTNLIQQLNEGMHKAAEPLIAKALKEIEIEMRKKLGSMIISYLDTYMEIDRYQQNLRIIVKQVKD